ncbi:MAG: ParB/Srx family N-terminal domain-containing protein [Methylotenera sp.]|nr:ParB/Srx family N-terminal domain-containing protein [Methylotenera sp.]
MEQTEYTQQDEKRLAAKSSILKRIKQGKPAPAKVNKLRLRDILSAPSWFQLRSNNQAASESHVWELIKHLERHPEQPFSPLVVYWVGDGWCVIDGHHRLEAYRATEFKQPIPVTVFTGTLDVACLFAASSNSKDKLSMSRREKSDAAWSLVISTDNSKAAIAKATCVSERSVGYMRAVMKSLSESHPEKALDELSWLDAMQIHQGKDIDKHTGSEDWVEKEAQELANRLCKQFGKRLSHNVGVTIRAIEIYDAKICEAISDWYSDPEDDEDDLPTPQLANGEEF